MENTNWKDELSKEQREDYEEYENSVPPMNKEILKHFLNNGTEEFQERGWLVTFRKTSSFIFDYHESAIYEVRIIRTKKVKCNSNRWYKEYILKLEYWNLTRASSINIKITQVG